MPPPFRADHVGSLLRPPAVLDARARHAAGDLSDDALAIIEDQAITDVVRMQEDIGLRSATDGEFRRTSWHMDFIYQLGGIRQADEKLTVEFFNDAGTLEFASAALLVDEPITLPRTIFAEAYAFLAGQTTTATPNAAISDRPAGMAVTTHMCRGNFRSSWAASGGYDFVAEALFSSLDVDGFFLEYDDERSGSFAPLRFVPPGKTAVLGLVTTKRGALENKDDLKRRIDEASRYVPLDQLCLSPQRGFSSTVEGNALTYDEQVAKLRLVVETAAEVWAA